MWVNVAGLVFCALVLMVASRIVYEQVTGLARRLHVPAFLIALLVVAFSTSIPELFVGITSALEGEPSFSLGDVIGANIVNLTFVAALAILLGRKDLDLSRAISRRQLSLTFVIASAPVLLLIDGVLSRLDGAILIALYGLYVLFAITNRERVEGDPIGKKTELFTSIGLFALGVTLLIGGSSAIVHFASQLSSSLQVSPFVVGLFAIALSTTLPEIVFAMRAGLQGNPELSIGDAVGSSAVNATLILGTVALILPIQPQYLNEVLATGAYCIFVFFVFAFIISKPRVKPIHGIALMFLYVLFASFNAFL